MSVFVGCSNFSTYQTARTLPPGDYRIHLGGGAFASNQLSSLATSSTSTTQTFVFPYAEVGGRIGLVKHLDGGAKYTFPGSFSGEVKWQLVDGSNFAGAVGFQAAYMPLSVNGTIAKFVDLVLPVFVSWDFNYWFGVYASARYLSRVQLGSNPTTTPFYSAGGGIRLGDRVGLLAEATYVKQGGSTFHGIQFGGAFFVGNAPSSALDSPTSGRGRSGDSPQESVYKRRPSVVLAIVDKGKSLRLTHAELRVWKERERVCVVDGMSRETACGMIVRSTAEGAFVRLTGRTGKVEPGMEVIPRP